MKSEKKDKLIFIFVCTLALWSFAHGYRFMNNIYTGDTLVSVFQDDIYWQRSLGRFMQPVTMVIRGCICAPGLIFGISVILFTVSIFVITEVLKIENRILCFLLCGILVCNSSITTSVAAFLPWVDIYSVALMLAVLGVLLYTKDKLYGYIIGSILFVCCMGFYQAYIDVALAMLVIFTIEEAMDEKKSIRDFGKRVLKTISGVILSGGAYWLVFKLVCKIHHVAEATTYNGVANVASSNGMSLIESILDAYKKTFVFLLQPGSFSSTIIKETRISLVWKDLLALCLYFCILITIVGIVYINIRRKTTFWHWIMQIGCMVVFPLAINFVCVMSKGMEHELMTFALNFVYVLPLFVVNILMRESIIKNHYKYVLAIVCAPILLLTWNNIVYSNQIYYKIEMQDLAGQAYATRVLDDIEDTEGYNPGITPVIFKGTPDKSRNVNSVIYFEDIGIRGNERTPFSYEMSFPVYLRFYLNANINESQEIISDVEISRMPVYPERGSIAFVGDTLVVKLSD